MKEGKPLEQISWDLGLVIWDKGNKYIKEGFSKFSI
jgi:hypothetical protein